MEETQVGQSDEKAWYAVCVKARREKGVGDHLARKGFGSFVPQYTAVRRYNNRLKKVQQPLFPGYTFCRLDPNDRLPVLVVPGVMHIVGDSSGPLEIPDSEIERVQRAVANESFCQPWPFLREGQRVQIISGPLRGVEGMLEQVRGKARVVLNISLLQRAVGVEVDRSCVKPIGEGASVQSGIGR